ncbi:MAG: hypothetical protein IT205_00370 [Fimbriimonadaceae bacterium]|nr:hypothetical protein [Fimbriimonadaceae bacterium]
MRLGLYLVVLLGASVVGCNPTAAQSGTSPAPDREAEIWTALDRNLDAVPQVNGDQIVIEPKESVVIVNSKSYPDWEISINLEPPYLRKIRGSSTVQPAAPSKVQALRIAWKKVRETRWSLLNPARFKVSEDKRWHNYAFNYLAPYEGSALGVRVERHTLKPEVMGSW